MARPEVLILFLLLIATISVVALAQDCTYTIKVQTGSTSNSGTDSTIGVVIADKDGNYIEIKNLETCGKMGSGHNYFESGNLDIFSKKEACLSSTPCFLTLSSDDSGSKSGWYVEYVDVEMAKVGSPSKRQNFQVVQWLALDEPPYELSTERNNCPDSFGSKNRKSVYSII